MFEMGAGLLARQIMFFPVLITIFLSCGYLFLLFSNSSLDPSHFRTALQGVYGRQLSDVISNDANLISRYDTNMAEILERAADFLDVLRTEHNFESLTGLTAEIRSHGLKTHEASLRSHASGELADRSLISDLGAAFGKIGSGGDGSALASAASALLGGLGNAASSSINSASLFLGTGVGKGAAAGLKISNSTTTVTDPKASGIDLIAENLGFGVASGLVGAIPLDGFITPGTLADGSAALGMGLGMGGAIGLALSTNTTMPGNLSGINLIAANLGNGVASSFLGQAKVSVSMTMFTPEQISSAIDAAGKGLGQGAAQGLKLSTTTMGTAAALGKRDNTGNSTAIDIAGTAETFTRSLSASFLGSINIQSLASQGLNSSAVSGLTQMVGPIAVGAASGFGSGAAVGLGLQNNIISSTPAGADAPVVARNFAYDLTTSFLANGTVSALGNMLMGNGSGISGVTSMLGPAAEGFGSGLGQGAAVGLGLQDAPMPSMGNDLASVAKSFSFGLTSSFLANGTAAQLTSKASGLLNSSMSQMQGMSVSQIAEGFARGLVDGAGSSISNAGGFDALLSGQTPSSVMVNSAGKNFADSASFNDSVGGAAIGFGRGLGGEGVNVVLEALGKISMSTNGAASSQSSGIANSAGRSIEERSYDHHAGKGLALRDLSNPPINFTGILSVMNTSAADMLLQKGVDTLTCTGVGGLVQIALGLYESGQFNLSSVSSVPTGALPNATFTIMNSGNTFDVNPSTLYIAVNGMEVKKFAGLLVAHILLGIIAFFVLIPLAFFLEHARGIALQMSKQDVLAKTPRTRLIIWVGVTFPFVLITFILGIVLIGYAPQFHSGHGILGLLTFLLFLIATPLELPLRALQGIPYLHTIVRPALTILILFFGLVLLITGFNDLLAMSLCATSIIPGFAYMIISFLLAASFFAAITTGGVRSMIWWWRRKDGGVSSTGEEGTERLVGAPMGTRFEKEEGKYQISTPVLIENGNKQYDYLAKTADTTDDGS